MRSHIERGRTRAERDGEAVLAVLRLLVFSAVTAAFWAGGALEHAHMAMFSFVALGAFATASLVLAWSGFFRPWLPWVFAPLGVSLLLHCVGPLAMGSGVPASSITAVPGTSLIFLLLATAAVRHGPALRAAGQPGNSAMGEPVPDQTLRARREPLRVLRQKPPAEPRRTWPDAAAVAS